MALYVTNNTAAMNTSRWLGVNTGNMENSLAKLSSGFKINSASDNPAGLVISEKLRAQLSGLSQAVSNNQEASNVVGITEGAMSEMNDILKKMEQLAIHAANSGITSTDQIVADQAEMDSSIQTIDRIANTTKYSDTYLLNGSQSLTFTAKTVVDSSKDETLLDSKSTKLFQVASLNTKINMSFTGSNTSNQAITTASAQKAFLEAGTNPGADLNGTAITADLGMTITGSLGNKTYSFGNGQSLGSLAATINEDASTTGVQAQLIFDSAITGVVESGNFATAGTTLADFRTTPHTSADISAYEMDKDFVRDPSYLVGSAQLVAGSAVDVGANTDADGNVYVKMTSFLGDGADGATGTYDIYKDSSMTTLVGSGTMVWDTATGWTVNATPSNNSGLSVALQFSQQAADTFGVQASDVIVVNVGNALETNTTGTGADGLTTSTLSVGGTDGTAGDNSVLSGVRLGQNTDVDGKIYMKTTVDDTANTITVELYNDSAMEEKNLVASSGAVSTALTYTANDASVGIKVFPVTSDGGNTTTGLYGTINMTLSDAPAGTGFRIDADSIVSSQIYAYDMGIRISSTKYGEDAKVSVEMTQGALFTDNSGQLVDKSHSGTDYGQSATVTVNGKAEKADQMTVTLASTQLNASLVFDEGKLGGTTIAVQGYVDGALSARVGQMDDIDNDATQPNSNTSETIEELAGGVQLQLGEGTNTYESSIISIESMTAEELGRTKFFDDFNGDGMKEWKLLSLVDMQSGGYADLSTDTDKAMDIIKAAIDDVSMARARLGAIQSNMLETNINSLNVAIENITSTESNIRDTDMSTESTEYTKNQILVQAATSMLAQANTLPQQALSLLQQ